MLNYTTDAGANWTLNIRGDGSNSLDSIMDMAVQMPLLKKIGDQMGVAFDENSEGKHRAKDKEK